MLADHLGYLYLDTGCMYRAVTLAALEEEIEVEDETAVTHLAAAIQIDIRPAGKHDDGRQYTVLLNGRDVTWAIRAPAVDANVSQVSSYAGVRAEMVRRQREFGRRGRVVMVGRDIGTVVMPEAAVKLYVTAAAAERARRRWRDRQAQGHTNGYETILAEVERRDQIDSTREHSPLRPAADAILVDTTARPPAAVLDAILELLPHPVDAGEQG